MRSIFPPVVLILVLLWAGCSSHKHEHQLHQLLENELSPDMPGIAAAVFGSGGKLLWTGAARFADTLTSEPLSPQHTFRIASITKTFEAAAILRLWELKKLGLDDNIAMQISTQHAEILQSGGYEPEAITIRQLLSHTSGMADHTHSPRYATDTFLQRPIWTRTMQLEELVATYRPVDLPGARFSYSDTGYILLGEIIENLSGQPMG